MKGLLVYLKVQAASILGSLGDYLTTIILVELFRVTYVLANFIGNCIGGILLFILCRNWALNPEKNSTRIQIIRFVGVFAGNLILSAIGIYILTTLLSVQYILAKTLVSVFLGLTYNFYMQKKFVFN